MRNVGRHERGRVILQALEPGRYRASGAYQPESGPASGLPLEWTARLSHSDGHAVFDGIYRHHVGSPEHPFRLDLHVPTQVLNRGRFELHCPHLVFVEGVFRAVGGGLVFAGVSEKRNTRVSLNIEVCTPGTLDAQGVLFYPENVVSFYWFGVSRVPTEISRANVVGLHTRRP